MNDEPRAAREPLLTEPPTISGRRARVWTIPLDRYPPPDTPAKTASLGVWLVDGPDVHVLWRCWVLTLVHLRPIEGAPPPALQRPDATHELLSIALHPEFAPDPLRPIDFGKNGMRPIDWAVQFRATSDATALKVLAEAIQQIGEGTMHPDTDFRLVWGESLQFVANRIGAAS